MNDYIKRTARFKFERDDDNGMLIGPEGCHYDSEAEAMYYDQIQLCGCGNPEGIHKFLINCLAATRDDHDSIIDHRKIIALVKANPETVAELVLHFLDSRELTEHGSSVFGSWLTGRGKQVLEIGVMDEKV